MLIAGVIAEYNPFHSGHAWHLEKTKRLSGCDHLVVCLAGSFTQRGEPTVLSKFDRVRMALLGGADAVFELPALYAVRSAEGFARGGVGVLEGLGADVLSFGAESDLDALRARAELSLGEDEAFTEALREGLSAGKSYARAFGEAAADRLGVENAPAPNDALAVEYLKALEAQHSTMLPLAVPRRGSYLGVLNQSGFAPASAIREALLTEEREAALAAVPEVVRDLLAGARPLRELDELLLYTLRGMTAEQVAALADVPEGLEHRVKQMADECTSRRGLIEAVKCKRYTYARLSRLMAHALLGITRELAEAHPLPEYARLLGFRKGAEPLLTELKQRAKLPIVSNPTEIADHPVFRLECRATDLRGLLSVDDAERRAGRDLTEKFIIV